MILYGSPNKEMGKAPFYRTVCSGLEGRGDFSGAGEAIGMLGGKKSVQALSPFWEESARCLPDSGPFFLEPGKLSFYCRFCGLEGAETEKALSAARRISGSIPMAALAWHCHRLLFIHKEYDSFGSWPELKEVLGDEAGAFYLLIALSMVPLVLDRHKAMGIPEDVTMQTCLQVKCFCLNHQMARGTPGIFPRQLSWLRNYTAGKLFRVGRFEYMPKLFQGGITVFRHRKTGAVAAFVEDGVKVSSRGDIIHPGDEDGDEGWVAWYEEDRKSVRGYPVSPEGRVLKNEAVISRGEWTRVLGGGSHVLDLHIPAGGGMTLEKCAVSFSSAEVFFGKHFPGMEFKALASSSWIFFNRLPEILGDDSNIARFQNELFLYPVPSEQDSGLWFIFFKDDIRWRTPAPKTSLQRAVYDYLAEGGKWRCGGMFFLLEDMKHFGSSFYRRNAFNG